MTRNRKVRNTNKNRKKKKNNVFADMILFKDSQTSQEHI